MSAQKATILVQLDTDAQPSVFDAVVAVDSGVDHLIRHASVSASNVRELVYGALFTRGPADLHRTALFIGGSDVSAGDSVLKAVKETFFDDFRVSVLIDSNGANTTAAAAVLAALEGADWSLQGVSVAVLAATGPVGQRVARLLSRMGASVSVGSRSLDRARKTADSLYGVTGGEFRPFSTSSPEETSSGLHTAVVVISAGASGATLLPVAVLRNLSSLKVAVDLNAVPPPGIEVISPVDRGVERNGVRCWGALGVGGTKMKIHKKAIQALFSTPTQVLDAEEVLEIGRSLS